MTITLLGIAVVVAPFLLGYGAIKEHSKQRRKLSILLWVLTGFAVFGLAVVVITVGVSAVNGVFSR